jgi:hypothetical protein
MSWLFRVLIVALFSSLMSTVAFGDGVPTCAAGTIILDALVGTHCSIDNAVFTFAQSGNQVPNPDGVFSTQAISFTPEVVSIGPGTFGIGFQLGSIGLMAQQYGDIGYSLTLLPGSGESISGLDLDFSGSVSTVSYSGICPFAGGALSSACRDLAINSFEGTAIVEPFANIDVQSAYYPHLGIACQVNNPLTCQMNSADFLIVVQQAPEPSSLLFVGVGLLSLIGAIWKNGGSNNARLK